MGSFSKLLSFSDENVPYKELFMGFSLAVYAFHTYLDIRQLKAIKLKKPPPELQESITEENYQKAQSYAIDKWWFGLTRMTYNVAENMALLSLNGLPFLWRLSGKALDYLLARTGYRTGNSEAWQTVVFVVSLTAIQAVISLPWSAYKTFVIEAKHGFNKSTVGLFISDFLKQMALTVTLLPPIVGPFTRILQVASPMVPLYLWGFVFGLSLVFMTIYPVLIAPLFNRFEPLPEGSLKEKIEALAKRLDFPLRRLYTVDGSKRSGHSNAYMYGFFKNKRIVLYDTLLNQCTEEEVVAVLAHELGHWKLGHTYRLFLMGHSVSLAQFCLFTLIRNSTQLYDSFGFGATSPGSGSGSDFASYRPVFIAFILFQMLSAPIDEVIQFLSHVVSRRFEFQADGFAVAQGTGSELEAALLKLEKENKGMSNVDPWYSAYHYSHPPLVERIRAIREAGKKEL